MCPTMRNQFGVEYMDAIFTIIRQDLEVAEKAIEKEDFSLATYAGNRIMMNLLVTDEIKLMLLGHMVRELGVELRLIKAKREDDFIDAKQESIVYIKDLGEQVASGNIDSKIYWGKYYEIEAKLRMYLLSNIESSVYDERGEFAKNFSIKLIDILYSRKSEIASLRNMVVMTSSVVIPQ